MRAGMPMKVDMWESEMEHKLYLNGQYLKTVDFPGFPPDVRQMFDLVESQKKWVRDYCWGEDLLIICFRRDGGRGLEGYWGYVDNKTEKRIRRLK